jgi:hypothetical protein
MGALFWIEAASLPIVSSGRALERPVLGRQVDLDDFKVV